MADTPKDSSLVVLAWTLASTVVLEVLRRVFTRQDRGIDDATALRAELRAENVDLKREMAAKDVRIEALQAQIRLMLSERDALVEELRESKEQLKVAERKLQR